MKPMLPFVSLLTACALTLWPPNPLSSQQRDDRLAALEARIAELERLVAVDQQVIEVFAASQSGVVRVRAGLGHGTGFFIRAQNGRRFIVTNDHVVAGGNRISVLLDSSTQVLAQLVTMDTQADLALIEIHDSLCADCTVLQLASSLEFQSLRPGAKVIAIGFPLHQRKTLTTGIVSAQADDAIFSDVALNPGNSGGPLLTLDGQVVAVNTFIDQGDIGPGVSGSVAVGRLHDLVDEASAIKQAVLPVEPLPLISEVYPMALLRRVATDMKTDVYRDYSGIDAEHFLIDIATPLMHVAFQLEQDEHVTRLRRQREDRAQLPESSRYAGLDTYRDWARFVGGLNRPAISITVRPFLGENLLGQTRFRGDLEGIVLTRNGVVILPAQGGTRAIRTADDVGFGGLFVYEPSPFAPDVGGLTPEISITLYDVQHPFEPIVVTLKPKVVARIWEDFLPFLRATKPNETFLSAQTELPDDAGMSRRYDIPFVEAQLTITRLIGASDYHVMPRGRVYSNRQTEWMVLAPGSMRRIRVRAVQKGRRATELWIVVDETDTTAPKLFEILDKGLAKQ